MPQITLGYDVREPLRGVPGALGNAIADDTAAIMGWIREAEIDGANVLLPSGRFPNGNRFGRYLVTDTLWIKASHVALLGSAPGGVRDMVTGAGADLSVGTGTVIVFRSSTTGKTGLKIGHQLNILERVRVENIMLRDDSNTWADCIWMRDVEYSYLSNLTIYKNNADTTGRAALRMDSGESGLQSTGNWVDKVHIYSPKFAGREGYGILLDCAGGDFNNGNLFTGVKINNAIAPGKSVLIRKTSGTPGDCNGHQFVGCRMDCQAGESGVEINTKWHEFSNCRIDGDGTSVVLRHAATAESCLFAGNVDGVIEDLQANANLKLQHFDPTDSGGWSMRGAVMHPRTTVPPAVRGAMYYDDATDTVKFYDGTAWRTFFSS